MTAKAKPGHAAALAAALVAAAEKHEGNEANFRRAAERALEKAVDALGIEVDTVQTAISTHTVKYIRVRKFDPANADHVRLAASSRAAHAAAAAGEEPDQDAVDRAAARIWGLTGADVEAMRVFFDELRKRGPGPPEPEEA